MPGDLQIKTAAHSSPRTVIRVGIARSYSVPSEQTVNEWLYVFSGKAQNRSAENLVGIVEIAEVSAAIHSDAKPLIEEVGDIDDESAFGIFNRECGRKSALGADDRIVESHPGITGENLPLGGFGFTSISGRSRTTGAGAGLYKMIVGTALSGICSLGC